MRKSTGAVAEVTQRQQRFMIVRNLKYATVTLTHPDDKEGVAVRPLEEVALDMRWQGTPDIIKLQKNGHIEVRVDDERPMPRPTLPPELTIAHSLDRSSAQQIAFNENDEIVTHMINVMPRLETPNASQNNPDIDASYLKQRHLPILKAAEWWLDNWQPGYIDWQGRLAHVRERIEFIQNYKP